MDIRLTVYDDYGLPHVGVPSVSHQGTIPLLVYGLGMTNRIKNMMVAIL